MPNPILDPSLPADHAPVSSAELRGQFQAISDKLDDCAAVEDMNDLVFTQTAGIPAQVQPLALTVSNPPTQAQVQAIANKLDELLAILKRS